MTTTYYFYLKNLIMLSSQSQHLHKKYINNQNDNN